MKPKILYSPDHEIECVRELQRERGRGSEGDGVREREITNVL